MKAQFEDQMHTQQAVFVLILAELFLQRDRRTVFSMFPQALKQMKGTDKSFLKTVWTTVMRYGGSCSFSIHVIYSKRLAQSSKQPERFFTKHHRSKST